jgi:hypothetical protein
MSDIVDVKKLCDAIASMTGCEIAPTTREWVKGYLVARIGKVQQAVAEYKSECENPAKDFVMRSIRRQQMFAALTEGPGVTLVRSPFYVKANSSIDDDYYTIEGPIVIDEDYKRSGEAGSRVDDLNKGWNAAIDAIASGAAR